MNTEEIKKKMAERGVSPGAIAHFLSCRESIIDGVVNTEQLRWNDIIPFGDADVQQIDENQDTFRQYKKIGENHLEHAVVIKLNGGRSTSMGGAIPKCFVEAKNGRSFLDICMQRIMHLNDCFKVEIPLVLMNSFFTNEVTKEIVGRTPLMILNFIQNEYPRLLVKGMSPLDTGGEEDWCPAGHGDFYISFYESGLLDKLLQLGYRWVFISNIDNLCADISPAILGMMIDNGHDFMMEVTRKTPVDIKGGAPAFINGHPGLLEIAQVEPEHEAEFQDINTFRYFNTNNLWIDMEAIRDLITSNSLHIPTILNPKTVLGHPVIQIETAMGAAMGSFRKPAAIRVPRSRFFPVKKMKDLLILQSDAFLLNQEFEILPNPQRPAKLPFLPEVSFRGGFMADNELKNWFADPASLSLVDAESLEIQGRVFFEKGVTVRGRVKVKQTGAGEFRIPADTVLTD
ncbi:UTP--glucose-1-phosphate uridylyltransferase [Desulfogranum japonicum]|uniref:UTP--glucose-1-phosphate uridylyltransferase n=1 Tax=Desulfogranum japonicum TaxID=231447 RepID=UPI0006842FAB|nr:UTP--glucose-1-phosphate uridylyltransferase [Desulfogranum japonicum]